MGDIFSNGREINLTMMKHVRHRLCCQHFAALLIVCLFCFPARGDLQTAVWQGGEGLWTDVTLWDIGLYPDDGQPSIDDQYLVEITGGTVILDTPITVSGLTLDANIEVTQPLVHDLNVNGDLWWQGGGFTGAGQTWIDGAVTLDGVADKTLIGRTLVSEGNVLWTGGNITGSLGQWDHLAGNDFIVSTDDDFNELNPQPPVPSAFHNEGYFAKINSWGETQMNWAFHNRGLVEVNSGVLSFNEGGLHTGDVQVAQGAEVVFSSRVSGHQFSDSSSITGAGQVELSGDIQFAGRLDVGGELTLRGDETLVIQPQARLDQLGSTLTIIGEIQFDTGQTVHLNALQVDGSGSRVTFNDGFQAQAVSTDHGEIEIHHDSSVVGQIDLNDGRLLGQGILAAHAGLQIAGDSGSTFGGITLENYGTATWSQGRLYGSDDGELVNTASGLFDIQADYGFVIPGGWSSYTLTNRGTVRKSAGAGVATIGVTLNNENQVQVQSGTLQLTGGGVNDGTMSTVGEARLAFTEGSYHHTAASRLEGFIDFTGADVTIDGTFQAHGDTAINGGTVTFSALPEQVTLGDELWVQQGQVIFNDNYLDGLSQITVTIDGKLTYNSQQPATTANMEVSIFSEFVNHGEVTIAQELILADSATLSGSGRVIAPCGMTLQGDVTADQIMLDNAGQVVVGPSDDVQLSLANGAVFHNRAEGTLELHNEHGQYFDADATSAFLNDGLIRKSSGAGRFSLSGSLTNHGRIEVNQGELALGGVHSYGEIQVDAGSSLLIFGQGNRIDAGSQLSGDGVVRFIDHAVIANDWAFNGEVSFGGLTEFETEATIGQVSSLTGNIGGSADVHVLNDFIWMAMGGVMGTGHKHFYGNVSIPRYGQNNTAKWQFSDTARIDNHGQMGISRKLILFGEDVILTNHAGATMVFSSYEGSITGGGSLIDNRGDMTFVGGQSLEMKCGLNNSGTLHVDRERLTLYQTSHSSGMIEIGADNILDIKENALHLTQAATVIGAGSLEVNGGMISNDGLIDVETMMTGGSLQGDGVFNGDVTVIGGAIGAGHSTFAAGVMDVGHLTIDANLTLSPLSQLMFDLGGTGRGEFDMLQVAGEVSFDGSVIFLLTGGYQPDPDDAIRFLTFGDDTGDFATVILPSSLTAMGFEVVFQEYGAWLVGPDASVCLPGDVNCDGVVGLLDLDAIGTHWQQGSRPGDLPAIWQDGDFNGDGVVGLLDLDLMGSRWGQTTPVPEPVGTIWMIAMGTLCGFRSHRFRCADH